MMNAEPHADSGTDLARMNRPTLSAEIGRYVLYQPIARGGMATVHAARFVAAHGVTRLVAAKRLHPHFTDDPEFVEMFHDEARIASCIHHPNVVPVLDVILDGEEVILVQEYVHGVPLSYLFKQSIAESEPMPRAIAVAVVSGILAGLHAAHEATDDCGEPLGVVHRDVSPQNIIVSVDGVPRLVDFGIAKARNSVHHTREGFLKGKLAYMAPEQLRSEPATRSADIYAAGVLLWEMLANRRFYDGACDADFVRQVALGATPLLTHTLAAERDAITEERWTDIAALEPIVSRALSASADDRFATAEEMATALLALGAAAPAPDLAIWVRAHGLEYLEKRQRILASTDESDRTATGSRAFEAPRFDDGTKSSGARMRLAADLFAPEESPSSTPPVVARHGDAITIARSGADRYRFTARALVPWVVVAALLVIVGLLAGIVLVREPLASRAAERIAPAEAPLPVATQVAAGTFELDVVAQPVFMQPNLAAQGATPATLAPSAPTVALPAPSAARPAPQAMPRIASPARVSPVVARPVPTPVASSARECNPPFFFDGTKKVFKPSCL